MNRSILGVLCAAVLVALSACSGTPASPSTNPTAPTNQATVTVSLATAQAEAKAIAQALQAEAPTLIATLAADQQAKAQAAMDGLVSAEAAFVGLPATNTSPAQYAQAVVQAATGVVTALPLPPNTKLAIDAGLILLQGLIQGVSNVTVTVPATSVPAAAMPGRDGLPVAPIAIPIA